MHGETEHGFSGSQVLQLASKGRGTLKERKVQPGDRVVLLSANSHRWVAADLAILGEGAVVVVPRLQKLCCSDALKSLRTMLSVSRWGWGGKERGPGGRTRRSYT